MGCCWVFLVIESGVTGPTELDVSFALENPLTK